MKKLSRTIMICLCMTMLALLLAAVFFCVRENNLPAMHPGGGRPTIVIDPGHGGVDGAKAPAWL